VSLKFNLKNGYELINIFFLSIPIVFFLPVNISNIFCILYLTIVLYFFKKNNLKIKIDILDKIFFLFFFIIIVSSLKETSSYNLTKENLVFDIISKISLVRFFLIYLLTKNILQYNLVEIKSFLKVSVFCTIFISINIILLHTIGFDLFGNKPMGGYRLSTIFGERMIAGTYLLNFFFFGLIYFYYYKKNNLIKYFFIFLIGLSIFLSSDRSPLILFLIFYFFLCLLNFRKDYKFTIIMISLLLIFFVLFLKNEKFKRLYGSIFFVEMSVITEPLINKTIKNTYASYYGYHQIYKDSVNTIFFTKTLIGSGKSSFYTRCRDYRLRNDPKSIEYGYAYACPNHTHNLYLEILIAGGLLGAMVFIVAIIIKFFLLTKNMLLQKPSYYTLNSILILSFLIEIFPFRPYGAIFNSYNGLFFFFKVSIIYGIIINQTLKCNKYLQPNNVLN